MADIDLKTATPDTTIADAAYLFGADSQSAANPSIYAVSTLRSHILGSTNLFTVAQTFHPTADQTAITARRYNAGATSNIFQVQDHSNNNLATFDKDGKLTVPGATVSSGSLTLSGNISSAAWTTNGIRYKNAAATLTDTSSSGTVAAAYTNVFGGNTIAASNSTTFTDYYTTYVTQPTAGTNVTFTRRWAQGFGGSILITGGATLPLQTLTDGTNVAWDCSSGAKAKVTLGGNRTMSAVTNAVEGTSYTLWVIQDATGSRTMSWTTSGAGSFDFGTEGTPVLTTTASAADLLAFEAVSIGGTLKLRFCGIKRGFA